MKRRIGKLRYPGLRHKRSKQSMLRSVALRATDSNCALGEQAAGGGGAAAAATCTLLGALASRMRLLAATATVVLLLALALADRSKVAPHADLRGQAGRRFWLHFVGDSTQRLLFQAALRCPCEPEAGFKDQRSHGVLNATSADELVDATWLWAPYLFQVSNEVHRLASEPADRVPDMVILASGLHDMLYGASRFAEHGLPLDTRKGLQRYQSELVRLGAVVRDSPRLQGRVYWRTVQALDDDQMTGHRRDKASFSLATARRVRNAELTALQTLDAVPVLRDFFQDTESVLEAAHARGLPATQDGVHFPIHVYQQYARHVDQLARLQLPSHRRCCVPHGNTDDDVCRCRLGDLSCITSSQRLGLVLWCCSILLMLASEVYRYLEHAQRGYSLPLRIHALLTSQSPAAGAVAPSLPDDPPQHPSPPPSLHMRQSARATTIAGTLRCAALRAVQQAGAWRSLAGIGAVLCILRIADGRGHWVAHAELPATPAAASLILTLLPVAYLSPVLYLASRWRPRPSASHSDSDGDSDSKGVASATTTPVKTGSVRDRSASGAAVASADALEASWPKTQARGLPAAWTPGKPVAAEDQVLSRQQTDEWKGAMVVMFAVCNYYNILEDEAEHMLPVVLTCVSCFTAITGFGHYTFFMTRADYSLRRVMRVLVRLNVPGILLSVTMSTRYILYYECALHSAIFVVIFTTMALHRASNADRSVIQAKLLALLLLLFLVFDWPDLASQVFEPLRPFLQDEYGDMFPWLQRIRVHHYASWFGVAAASVFPQAVRLIRWVSAHVASTTLVLVAATTWLALVAANTQLDTASYAAVHPVLTIVPILVFVLVRNSTAGLRAVHVAPLAWLGTFSLELTQLQLHVLLARSGHARLLWLPGAPLANTLVSVCVWIALARMLFVFAHAVTWVILPDPLTNRQVFMRIATLAVLPFLMHAYDVVT